MEDAVFLVYMSANHKLARYYQRPKDIRKQFSYLLPIVAMFFVTVLYASGLRNHTIRTALYYLSLVYPAVILFSLSFTLLKLSYFQLDSDGVYITLLGIFHKRILWANIESVGKAAIGNVEGIGLMYKPSFNHYVFGRKNRRKMFGWDELLADAYQSDGRSLLEDAVKSYKTYSRH